MQSLPPVQVRGEPLLLTGDGRPRLREDAGGRNGKLSTLEIEARSKKQGPKCELLTAARRARRARAHEAVIRVVDVAISILVLALLSPLMLAIAVLIKATSPGPVLFRQIRIGANRRKAASAGREGQERRRQDLFGKPFRLYKFRTMFVDARTRFPHLYSYEYTREQLRSLPIKVLVGLRCSPRELKSEEDLASRILGDPRLTAVGRWLRRTSLDELPNFVSVLNGDMHLVGPRPDIYENIRYYDRPHLRKLEVKPGVTGLAQIRGRGRLSFVETNEQDLEYVYNRSLWLDLKILLKTIPSSLKGEGAF